MAGWQSWLIPRGSLQKVRKNHAPSATKGGGVCENVRRRGGCDTVDLR